MNPCFYSPLPCTEAQRARLRAAAAPLPAVFADECTGAQREEALRNAVFIFGEPDPARLPALPELRVLQLSWAGADRYTNAPAFPQGLTLACATGAYGGLISEYVIGVILAMFRQLPRYVRQQAEALWQPHGAARRLCGATVLILGAGDIGMAVAHRLRPFGARCLGVRRTARETPPDFESVHTQADLPDLLPRADVVVGCLPDTPETRGLLDETALRAMKPGALLVNVGRGTLIDLDALARVLAEGRLLGAALDVTSPEPLPPAHPLWAMDNVLLTPHVAGVGFGSDLDTQDRIVDLCCENLRRFHAGQPLRSVVDLETGYRKL